MTKDLLYNRLHTINMILEDLRGECLENPGTGLDEIYVDFRATSWTFQQWLAEHYDGKRGVMSYEDYQQKDRQKRLS